MIRTISPKTGAILREYPTHSEAEVTQKIEALGSAQRKWARAPFERRKAVLFELARRMRERKKHLAQLASDEMGKLLPEAEGEVEKCAKCAEYYGENGEKFLTQDVSNKISPEHYVHYAPLGIVFAVMPWNFPYWQAIRCAVPAIMAGNTVLLKHASNVTGCALAIEELFRDLVPGMSLLETILIEGKDALRWIGHPLVAAVSFTGSTDVGRKIGEAAGKNLKKCVLELGGSDPYVVLADAGLDFAAKTCAFSRLINAGQSCIAAKRFIVEDAVYSKFLELFIEEIKKPELAPLARKDLRDDLHKQVEQSIAQGAKLLLGGKLPSAPGAYYPATVLSEVTPGMVAFNEELFGPVAAVVRAKNLEDAIELANNSTFGLGAAVFTTDDEVGETIARERLEAGACFVNNFVRSDPSLPFGGIKNSGFGRELGREGIKEFVNVKTVYIGE